VSTSEVEGGITFTEDSLSKENGRMRFSGTEECQSCDKVGHKSARVGLRIRVVSRDVSESGSDVAMI